MLINRTVVTKNAEASDQIVQDSGQTPAVIDGLVEADTLLIPVSGRLSIPYIYGHIPQPQPDPGLFRADLLTGQAGPLQPGRSLGQQLLSWVKLSQHPIEGGPPG